MILILSNRERERLIEVSFGIIIYRLGNKYTVTNCIYTFKTKKKKKKQNKQTNKQTYLLK
jgi:hypothetical protein